MKKKPKHILVIRLSAMGDVAMSVPVLKAFTEQYPTVKLTILTRPFFKPFFNNLPNITVFDIHLNAEHKGVKGLYKLSKQLKKINIDAIADLHNVLRSRILKLFLVGKPFVQINKGRAEKKALVSGESFKQLKTTHQRYADVFEKLGYKINLSNPTFLPRPELSTKTKNIIANSTKTLIGIAPFAQYESKMYPLDLMEKVIENLSKSNNYTILLFGGGRRETRILEKIQKKFANVINISGQLPFENELNLISNLNLMLAMDSGNAHIAAMYGVKTMTLWGVTHPYAGFYPFNQDANFSLLSSREKFPKIPTSVYGNKFPEGYKNAMKSINFNSVLDKIESIL